MYKSFYKLEKNPFEPAPDPEFLYLGPIHKKAISYLKYSLDKSVDFIQLTGEIGCGKTILILTLLKGFGQDISYAYVVDPKLPFPALLRTLLCQFGIKTDGCQGPKDVLLAQFHEYLKEQGASGRRVLVILDEAQNIEPAVLEELRMLSNLDTGKQRPLLTILVGQPEFRSLLARPTLAALKQRITVAAHLPPLTRQETERYISCRLRQAGANGRLIFTSKAINEIFEFSRGIPRLINLACESSLLAGYVEEKARLDDNLVGAVIKELKEDLQCPTPLPSPKDRTPKKASRDRVLTPSDPIILLDGPLDSSRRPEDKEIKKTSRRKRLARKGLFKFRKLKDLLKSKKLKIAFFSTIGVLGAVGLGLSMYLLI